MTVRDLADVKTEKEMKDVLMQKLKEENCCFKRSEIKIQGTEYGYKIWVVGYEHSTFKIHFEYDSEIFFEYETWVSCGSEEYNDWEIECVLNSKQGFRLKEALINIGYCIGTRF